MVNRRDLKREHEEAVLRKFGSYLDRRGIELRILGRPDPPEAIVEIDGKKTWIEITDAYLDESHAIGLTTGACDDVKHIPDAGRLVIAPDEIFSTVLYSVVKGKYEKPSMQKAVEIYGPGILLVGVFSPFTTAELVAYGEAAVVAEMVSKHPLQVFETIYVYDGAGERKFYVLYHRKA